MRAEGAFDEVRAVVAVLIQHYLPALRRGSDQRDVIEAGRALLAGGIVDGRAEAAAAGSHEQQVAFADIDGHCHGRPQGG
ncbi:hypothetical protein G6F35_015963 [Rhizopus arrhizus]|nr:hypothetical protein G6F35_015963 [Rhizopus arrhizus]